MYNFHTLKTYFNAIGLAQRIIYSTLCEPLLPSPVFENNYLSQCSYSANLIFYNKYFKIVTNKCTITHRSVQYLTSQKKNPKHFTKVIWGIRILPFQHSFQDLNSIDNFHKHSVTIQTSFCNIIANMRLWELQQAFVQWHLEIQ